MNSAVQIHNILKEFFPFTLSVSIVEYLMIIHQFEKKTTLFSKQKHTTYFDRICSIGDGKIWIYNFVNNTLCHNDFYQEHSCNYYTGNYIVVCKEKSEIYVSNRGNIHVFNKKCEKKYSITIVGDITLDFVVLNNNIYAYEKYTDLRIIYIYDMSKKNMRKIKTEESIKCVRLYDNHIYILYKHNQISQYTAKFEAIRTFSIDNKIITDFCIIDNYFCIQPFFVNALYIYDDNFNFVDQIPSKDIAHIFYENNILYIRDDFCRITLYDVKKSNLMKMLAFDV